MSLSHQHGLVQHLTSLHISCFDINAVRPTLPVVNKLNLSGEEKRRTSLQSCILCCGFTHTCMSLKHLMQSIDLFSVENRM